jgi:hypothetical protein
MERKYQEGLLVAGEYEWEEETIGGQRCEEIRAVAPSKKKKKIYRCK